MLPALSNMLVSYAIPISMDTVSLNDVLDILPNLTISKISSAFHLILFAVSLLVSSSLSYIRTSNLLDNFLKAKFVSSIASVS